MRVRPFFWGLFALVCLSILAWAAVAPSQVPARLSIHLMRPPTPDTPTPFLVVVTDAQGATIDNAQLVSQAWMTNMSMAPSRIFTTPEGQGTYLIRITLDMVGPWMIAVSMQVNGFARHGLKSRGINAGWNLDQGSLFLTGAALGQVTKYLAQTGAYLVNRHRTDQDRVLTLEGTHMPSSSFPQFRGLPLFTLPLCIQCSATQEINGNAQQLLGVL
jgi:hypothetical protein